MKINTEQKSKWDYFDQILIMNNRFLALNCFCMNFVELELFL